MKTNRASIFLLKALKSRKVRLIIDFGIITLIGLAIFRNFLFSSCWPAGGDILGWISRAYLFGHDFRWAYTWRPHSFGFPENIYIVDLFYMILHFFLSDPVFLIKLVMFLSFIFAGFSAYMFAFSSSCLYVESVGGFAADGSPFGNTDKLRIFSADFSSFRQGAGNRKN